MSDCLGEAGLERVATGSGTSEEIEHVANCAKCDAEVELLVSFVAANATDEEAAVVRQMERSLLAAPAWRPVEKKSWSWLTARPLWGLALAAALMMGLWLRNPAGPEQVADDVVRSGQIEDISVAGDVAAPPEVLRWKGTAAAYDVRLLDVEGQTLWQAKVTAPVVALPAEARALMTEKKTLTWKIAGIDAQGAALTVSASETFRVVSK
ncbi:MAG: hypothetical protein JNM66_32150 [Bryobacterales bacterium]|nr:hypothetical protein [Bryobacterales bacterium]